MSALGLERSRALLGQAEERGVFAEAGEILLALPLVLDAQEVHHIGVGQDGIEVVRDGHAELLEVARDERARARRA